MLKMATDQTVSTVPVGDQEEAPAVINEFSAPLNFTELTPNQFGISVESFVPSSSNCTNKSRLAQLKARRRSSVGVRGSPETNSLIRFRAHQRMKTPPTSHTPEVAQTPQLVRGSPFPRVASTLRQKMASFQSLMDVAESDGCDPTPAPDSDAGGCISTRDYLSEELSCSEGKENNPPATPTARKRRRLGLPEGCSPEIREGNISAHHPTSKEQEDAVCKHRSPSDDPSAASAARQAQLLHIPSFPSLLEMKPTEVEQTLVQQKKRKQVHFGGPLSPELFDKNLPPSTPLQKGGTPARAATPGGGLRQRSALKTPQRSDPDGQQSPPELFSPAGFGGSPTFSIPRKRRTSEGRDGSEDDKVVFPSLEEIDSAVLSDPECAFDAQPLNLNSAFHEESLSEDLGESKPEPNRASPMDECERSAEEKQPEDDADSRTPTRPRNRRRAKVGVGDNEKEVQSDSEPRARPGKRKRKEPEDSEPVKRSTRSAAKSACGKMKVASSAARRWNKDVDRSLYGSRAYASKNPTLSPITERRSFSRRSSAELQTPESSTATHQGSVLNLETEHCAPGREDSIETEAVGNVPVNSVGPPSCSPESDNRRPRASVSRQRRKRRRKVDVADCEVLQEEDEEQLHEAPSSLSLEGPQEQAAALRREKPSVHVSTDDLHSDPSESESADSPPSGEETTNTEPAKTQAEGEQGTSQEEARSPGLTLAPWQADFNFEDVFKPVATRGQRSVRRSLRNQANPELGAGLSWVPRTSPQSVRGTRRRSRQRPVQPAVTEETREEETL